MAPARRRAGTDAAGFARPTAAKDERLLLRRGFSQPLAVLVISRDTETRTGFRQPSVAHCAFERPGIAINRPGVLAENAEAAKPSAAQAACICKPRTSSCRPIQHLDLEIVRVPGSPSNTLHQKFSLRPRPLRGSSGSIGYRSTALLRALPFLIDGSGSIVIRWPFSSVLLSRLKATATSD
jgi:hypothetical protein